MARVRILGTEYVAKESIKNIKKTYLIQQKFVNLGKKVEGVDGNPSLDQVSDAIGANVEMLDATCEYIADVLNNEKITVDFLEENLSQSQIDGITQKLVNDLLHIKKDGAPAGKK